ncbi:hypothetical protein [Pseudanabaena sp. PCC 6802]|uniref:hypothetical protein n=1 Tax=Pseudanabaena sp. PCC 6802 TaxID=118173 RepID=UPI0003457371|nr:hypothetical protein [Pseudanabaena sp. PCC 6802]
MTIVVTLSPELEALLRERATQQGQDVGFIASELLTAALRWEEQDLKEAISGIQRGLDDFEAGQFRAFQDFAEEQGYRYNLPITS